MRPGGFGATSSVLVTLCTTAMSDKITITIISPSQTLNFKMLLRLSCQSEELYSKLVGLGYSTTRPPPSTYFAELTLASVVNGGAIGHACQVVQGVHAGGEVGVA